MRGTTESGQIPAVGEGVKQATSNWEGQVSCENGPIEIEHVHHFLGVLITDLGIFRTMYSNSR